MAIRSQIKATLLATFAVIPISIWSCTVSKAAEPLGVKIWDVSQFRSEVARVNRKYVSVYGDMTIIDPFGPITIRDRAHPESFIQVDLRQLSSQDTTWVHSLCDYGRTCDLIITGVFRWGKLRAEHAYFFVDFKTTMSNTASAIHSSRTRIPGPEFDASGTDVTDLCKACSHVSWDVCTYCDDAQVDSYSHWFF